MKELMNLDSLFCYCHRTIVLLCGALPSFLHLCLYTIHQTVLIVVLLIYPDLPIKKKPMNLDRLAYFLTCFCSMGCCLLVVAV